MIKLALDSINERIAIASRQKPANIIVNYEDVPRLVAVSKFKPVSAIIEAYNHGQRYFGENYIKELEEKSNSPEIIEQCPDIKFHFIGHLQSNKVNKLANIRNLYMIETIDSVKLANLIDKSLEKDKKSEGINNDVKLSEKLNVMIQVNTSEEQQKNGLEPGNVTDVAQHIVSNCKNLCLRGLMTIGSQEDQSKDFAKLYEIREEVCHKLGKDASLFELSMGMSNDFEEAIRMGSTNVRVGSLIFGQRN